MNNRKQDAASSKNRKTQRAGNDELAPGIRRKRLPRGRPFALGNTVGAATQFPKGVSGNAEGRPKYAVVAEAARALLAAPIPDDPEGRLFAEGICHQLGWMALAGDIRAAETLSERAEGRARQGIDFNDGRSDPLAELIAEFRKEHERIKVAGAPTEST
jgi:Family of unknown function (DUF5681)